MIIIIIIIISVTIIINNIISIIIVSSSSIMLVRRRLYLPPGKPGQPQLDKWMLPVVYDYCGLCIYIYIYT